MTASQNSFPNAKASFTFLPGSFTKIESVSPECYKLNELLEKSFGSHFKSHSNAFKLTIYNFGACPLSALITSPLISEHNCIGKCSSTAFYDGIR